jgi:hypothetical protein
MLIICHYRTTPQISNDSNKQTLNKKMRSTYYLPVHIYIWVGTAQLVEQVATGWTVWGLNPGRGRFFAHIQTGPGAHPTSCTMGTGSFPAIKRPGCGADPPPLLAPRSRECRAIPLPPLWAFKSVTGYLYLLHIYIYHISYRWNMNLKS